MDAIIRGIKERYSQEVIAQMSNEELSQEVMNEIMSNPGTSKRGLSGRPSPYAQQNMRKSQSHAKAGISSSQYEIENVEDQEEPRVLDQSAHERMNNSLAVDNQQPLSTSMYVEGRRKLSPKK